MEKNQKKFKNFRFPEIIFNFHGINFSQQFSHTTNGHFFTILELSMSSLFYTFSNSSEINSGINFPQIYEILPLNVRKSALPIRVQEKCPTI